MKMFYRILTKEQHLKYSKVCLRAWGCLPLDIDWAIQTKHYQEMETKLISENIIDILPIIEPII